jgi:O-methyltransferase
MAKPTGQLTPEAYAVIWNEVKGRTMVPEAAVLFAAGQVVRAARSGVPGVIVECGVWRGGCALAMRLAQRYAFGRVKRPVYLFDSFEGLPTVAARDGPAAAAYQKDVTSPTYYDNCRADLVDVTAGLQDLGFSEGEYHLVKGWFADTLVAADQLFGTSHIAVCASTATGTNRRPRASNA